VSLVNVWVAVPGIFLLVYLSRGILAEDADITLFTVLFTSISVGLLLLLTRKMPNELRGSVVLNGAFVNGINLPFPLLQVLMGSYSYAVSFATANNIVQIVVAKLLQGRFKTGRGGGTRGSIARAVPLVALGTGLVLHYAVWSSISTPIVVDDTGALVDLLIAVNFVYFGFSLGSSMSMPGAQYSLRSRPFLTTAIFRILAGPLLGIALAIPLKGNFQVFLQVVFEAMMPPAVTNTIFASIYGFDVTFAAKSATVLTPINTLEAIGVFFLLQGFV
jgi:predicted permease